MKLTRPALLLLFLWLVLLAGLTWFVQRQLQVGTDLRLFLPSPTTPEQRLLLEEIGEGPASRVMVISLEGAEPEQLADASRTLVENLQSSPNFRLVTNGDISLDSVPDELLAYRYLLSPTLDERPLDQKYLHSELQERARDLASPAGAFLEPWLPRDPTLELLKVLQRWQPMQEPNRLFDVWFDQEGKRALLLAQTRAAAFDPDQQRLAVEQLNAEAERLKGDDVTLTFSGAGKFSVMMEERTRGEATALGTAATVGMIILLLIAYRRIGSVILSALPLASAGLAGLAAVSALFGTVHGITLAFGFTLIGVAQDYPIHLLSHRHATRSPVEAARELWPTLATGVASTCIAYVTFLFSGVIGLAQLACFTVAGLAVAGLTTRFALPVLMDPEGRDFGESAWLGKVWQRMERLPRPRWAGVAAIALSIAAMVFAPQPMWESDLSKLTPVPKELLIQDQELRSELGTPDVRYLLVITAADTEYALQKLEELDEPLQKMVADGAISGYDHAARYVPTAEKQRQRQARLPEPATLRDDVDAAVKDTPFRPDVFEPFLADVEKARHLRLLTVDQLRDSPLGVSVEMLLTQHGDGNDKTAARTTALVTFSGVQDVSALERFAKAAGSGVTLLDTKNASETLVTNQRIKILWSLAVAAVLLAGVVTFALRRASRVYRVLAPMALTTLLIIGILQAAGVSMTLFHLIALILAAGLGLDYALFFEHAADDPMEQRRTLHALLVCSASTLMVFALLAMSSLPVLRALGLTVSIGVVSNFVLALLLTRPTPPPHGT
ncbi:membrane protein [Steroidobacter agaridevorans]|uniref:Membrane protein n=1 Tax=Steroidobacter agaridevorans TaxID=2695856 RepID=A0A829Y721_9GAMM|nr:MMPL family transporter [Steroidobacter agaridevorans]GFE78718.1 membrane protein [Steroidobacter agaridevorans]